MVEAYSTFSGLGFLALQVGRQKIPVVRTQAKNRPSNDWSRSTSARYISAGVGSNIMSTRIRGHLYCALPENGRAIFPAITDDRPVGSKSRRIDCCYRIARQRFLHRLLNLLRPWLQAIPRRRN